MCIDERSYAFYCRNQIIVSSVKIDEIVVYLLLASGSMQNEEYGPCASDGGSQFVIAYRPMTDVGAGFSMGLFVWHYDMMSTFT